MDKLFKTLLFSCVIIFLCASSYAQNCSDYEFSNNNLYTTCNSLSVLNAFLHWTYHQSNHTVDLAYRHNGATSSNWVAWALNVDGSGMLGAQCLVALRNSSGAAHAYTSAIPSSSSGYSTSLAESSLSFNVPKISAEFTSDEMIIYATIELPTGRTSFDQVWQIGPVSSDSPTAHTRSGENLRSSGTVDFISGQTTAAGGGANSREKRRNIHGVLNAVSWGILMPMGAIIARYMKVFKSADPAWFYLHVACQSSAYIIGVAGWGTGLKLGSDSTGIKYDTHRNIGITLFCFGTLQVFALLLRPKKDHKYRIYWNFYHYAVGYAVIIMSIINIFEGFEIFDKLGMLEGKKKWRWAYIGILIFLGATAAILEAFTWLIVLKRKKTGSDKVPYIVGNGANGVNGHGTTSQQAV